MWAVFEGGKLLYQVSPLFQEKAMSMLYSKGSLPADPLLKEFVRTFT